MQLVQRELGSLGFRGGVVDAGPNMPLVLVSRDVDHLRSRRSIEDPDLTLYRAADETCTPHRSITVCAVAAGATGPRLRR